MMDNFDTSKLKSSFPEPCNINLSLYIKYDLELIIIFGEVNPQNKIHNSVIYHPQSARKCQRRINVLELVTA